MIRGNPELVITILLVLLVLFTIIILLKVI